VILIIESLRLRFGIVILPSSLLSKGEGYAKKIFSKTGICREAAKNSKKRPKTRKKIAHAYGSKSKF
jgi:hypothetical protein